MYLVLVVSKCMLSVIRPDFEVVREGQNLNKIKHLHSSFLACIKPPRPPHQDSNREVDRPSASLVPSFAGHISDQSEHLNLLKNRLNLFERFYC